MKKNIILLNLILPMIILGNQALVLAQTNNFVLKGKLGNLQAPAKIYIGYTTYDGVGVYDSARVVNGIFEIRQQTSHPVNALLSVSRNGKSTHIFNTKDIRNVYIEPNSTILIQGNEKIAETKISGSKTQAEYENYQAYIKPYTAKLDELRQESAARAKYHSRPDSVIQAERSAFNDRWRDAISEKNKVTKQYILLHPNEYVSLDLLSEYAGPFINYIDVEPIYDRLSVEIRNSVKGKLYARAISEARATAVGIQAPEFTQADTSGKLISLSSFKGKFLLLDFWASWCAPCRAENPELKKIYNEFKGRNFTILGASLDNNKKSWEKAIRDDDLPWYHVSDLKYWKNKIALAYGITSVPQNVLIDPSGKIIARNLNGAKLREKLTELLR